MAFENNQQDAFNLRNDTESLKQWQSELDKATTSIGAAEVAAEEELAALKFKNLSALQDARIAKLDQLIALEDKGIRELAKARLTLSDRQFELRKKEIQKEFQLAKNAAEELLKIKNKKTQTSIKKPAASTEDISNASKAKSTSETKKDSIKTILSQSIKKLIGADGTTAETVELLSSIDEKLDSILDIVNNKAQPNELKIPTELTKIDTADTVKAVEPTNAVKANDANASILSMPAEIVAAIEAATIGNEKHEPPKDNSKGLDEAKFGEELLAILREGIEALVATAEQKLDDIKAAQETKAESTVTENIKEAGQKAQTNANTKNTKNDGNGSKGTKDGQGTSTKATKEGDSEKQYTSDATLLKAVELGKYSSEAILGAFDAIKSDIKSTFNVNLEGILKQVTANGGNNVSQYSRDLAGDLIASFNAAATAEENLQKFKENATAEELNRQLTFEKVLQDRRKALADKEFELRISSIKAEANIAFNAAHADELMAQKLHARQTAYAEEYQKYQLEAGKYAISREEFEMDLARKEREAAKKEATDVSKILSDLRNGKLDITGLKKSISKAKGPRTAELKEKYNTEKVKGSDKTRREQTIEKLKKEELKKIKKDNPGISAEEAEAKAQKAAEKRADEAAEASANLTANFELLASAAGGLAAVLDADVKKISSMQGFVDTRLQGSRVNDRDFGNGSYWNELLEDMKKIAGASPFIKQEKLVDNVKALVDKGISFDIKQRAFLMTVQEKIANTFNVADGTLLRLIRIQQQDTTAGRLGMESALNSFLNSMYETSEYLENVASSVRGSLEEMQALMEGAAATELEFQVQKWMGSLYSVGMSQEAVQNIARTFGQIASGDVSGLTGSGTGNLLIMAANEAGKSIADILRDGLDAKETNELMQAMVNYLAEIAETSSDSRVVQQQLANVYGMKASDLKAATNLASSIKDVSKQDLTYSGMMGQLNHMMNTIRLRTSVGEGMTNMWDNVTYSMASTQASNPILYMLPKMADLLRDVTGGDGIALPFLNVMGFGVDLNTSVADLMSVASMAGTALGALGPVLTGLSDLANPLVGSTMLLRAGINPFGKAPVLARGKATPLQNLRGASISESGYIGQGSATDIKNQTMQGAEDDKKKLMIKAKDEESADDVATKANLAVVNIYNLLEEVAHGSQSLRVRVVNSNAIGGGGTGSSGSNNIIGEGSGAGSTGAMSNNTLANGTTGSTDNGNWVLAM